MATITAVAALGSGAIVATASILVSHVNQEGQNERVERRLDEEARGAARALLSRFATTSSYARAALGTNQQMSFRPDFAAPAGADDVKLVMGRLTADEFFAVDKAMSETTSFFALFEVGRGRPLSADDRARVKRWRDDLGAAEEALASVADLPE